MSGSESLRRTRLRAAGQPFAAITRMRARRSLLALSLLVLVFGLGAIDTWVLMLGTLLGMGAFALADPPRWQLLRNPARALLCLNIALIAYTALQCLPLPSGLLAAASPHALDTWQRTFEAYVAPARTSWALSLDPVATRIEVLRGACYLQVFLCALSEARSRDGIVFLERMLLAATVLMAVLAVGHPAVGTERVFGVYRPYAQFTARHTAPLLNGNHLGGFLNLGVMLALGQAIHRTPHVHRAIAAGSWLVLVATEVFVASRGALACTLLGSFAVLALTRLYTRTAETQGDRLGVALAGMLCAAIVVALTASETSWDELASRDLSKFQITREAVGLVRKFPLFGVGRGAFESTFPSVRAGRGDVVFTHPENLVTQWVSEWGIPIAILALCTCIWALRPSRIRFRPTTPVGAFCAIGALALQNLVDFGLEVPGVASAAAVLVAIVVGGDRNSAQRAEGDENAARQVSPTTLTATPRWRAVTSRWLPVALGAVALAVVAPVEGLELDHERHVHFQGLEVASTASTQAAQAYFDRVRAAALRHPAAPYFPYLSSVLLDRRSDPKARRFAARALELSPVYGRAHLVIAHSLVGSAPAQARLEYRLAYEQDGMTFDAIGREALPLVRSFQDARELLPRDPARPGDLDPRNADAQALRDIFAQNLEPRLPAAAQSLDTVSLQLDPKLQAARIRNAERALRDLRAHAAWCEGEACAKSGLAETEVLRTHYPRQCIGYSLRARIEAELGNTERGFSTLEAAIADVEDRAACLRELAQLAANFNSRDTMTRALDRLVDVGCTDAHECKTNLTFAIGLEAGKASTRGQLRYVRKALEADRADAALWQDRANLCKQLQLFGEAADAFDRLAELLPADRARWASEARAARTAGRTANGPSVPTAPR